MSCFQQHVHNVAVLYFVIGLYISLWIHKWLSLTLVTVISKSVGEMIIHYYIHHSLQQYSPGQCVSRSRVEAPGGSRTKFGQLINNRLNWRKSLRLLKSCSQLQQSPFQILSDYTCTITAADSKQFLYLRGFVAILFTVVLNNDVNAWFQDHLL